MCYVKFAFLRFWFPAIMNRMMNWRQLVNHGLKRKSFTVQVLISVGNISSDWAGAFR